MKKVLRKIYAKFPLSQNFKEKIRKVLKNDSKEILNRQAFFHHLEKAKVISFDIFDTLISRVVYNPDDIFYLIEEQLNIPNFIEKRKKAENYAREQLKKDVNLDEIYHAYTELYGEKSQEIKDLEINLELELCIPRKDMLDIYNKLKADNKKIILTSDMYLPKKVIIKMLAKCGYKDFDTLYLSNELNKRKDTQEIWPYLIQKYGKNIVHVGDNIQSDYINPQNFGIKALKIDSPRESFSKTEMFNYVQEFINNKNVSDSSYLVFFVNKIVLNSPFTTLKIDTIEDFSYVFHGFIINSFLEYICTNNKNEEILFLAREGYNLQKLYKYYCQKNDLPEIDNKYFLASRKSTMTAIIKNVNELEKILDNDYQGTIKDYFSQILDIDYNGENFDIKLPDQKEKILPIIKNYSKVILPKYKIEKENYLNYIQKTVGEIKNNKVSIVDLGYSGTIQKQLSEMTKKEFTGYYLVNSSKVKKYSEKSQLNFLFNINDNKEYEKIYNYSLILEYFLTAPHGQLIRFTKVKNKVEPVFNNETISQNKQETINKINISVKNCIDDFAKLSSIYKIKTSKNLICRLYTCMIESGIITRNVKDQFMFMDAFCSNEERNVFKIISRY